MSLEIITIEQWRKSDKALKDKIFNELADMLQSGKLYFGTKKNAEDNDQSNKTNRNKPESNGWHIAQYALVFRDYFNLKYLYG